jgi:hypothetical protein
MEMEVDVGLHIADCDKIVDDGVAVETVVMVADIDYCGYCAQMNT